LMWEGGSFFFFFFPFVRCIGMMEEAFFSNMTKMWYTNTWKNNSRMNYSLFLSCFIGNYIVLSFVGYEAAQ
jgi:hypothetical protein